MTEWKTLTVLFPGARRLILSALFAEPDRWWTVAELARRVGQSARSTRPYLARLLDCGLIHTKQDGGQVSYQPDRSSNVYAEIASMMLKLSGQTGSATILVVEDQLATAQVTRILLESWGYRVLEAHLPGEALQIFDQQPDIQLLLSDVNMPGMSGTDLACELRRLKPELSVVLMSGDVGAESMPIGCAFLQKPFNPSGLARIVRRELEHFRPRINGSSY
jgi:CheY-like chemotaxis protein